MRRLCWLVLICSACSIGTTIKRFAPSNGPDGVATTVRRGRAFFNAELLAATDTALLLVREPARVVLVRYDAASRVEFTGLPAEYTLRRGRSPDSTTLERLRLWSRFPAGVDSLLLQRLLSAYRQGSLEVLAPCTRDTC
jgi:hypothetical protein